MENKEQSPKIETSEANASKCCRSLEFYRKLIREYVERHDYGSAIYWADKMVSLSGESQQDIFTLAQCFYFDGQYRRASNLLFMHNYERSNLYFRVLTAKCLLASKEYSKAIDVLDLDNRNLTPGYKIRENKWDPGERPETIIGQIHLLKGKVNEALMNRVLAAQNYRDALHHDVYCFEAFHLLTKHQMLSIADETEFFEGLLFEKDCSNGDAEFVKYLYSINIKKYASISQDLSPVPFVSMQKNLDVLTGDAERMYYNCEYLKAYKVCSEIMNMDPLHVGCLPLYLACLVELKKTTELFKTSHRLVDMMPTTALAWYSVGSYYFLIGKHECARRNLNKALSLDPVFGPAWLLFGHSFASHKEHDQAMAAYFKATQLMKGCHLPMLHVGMQCGLSNNPQLAMKFLDEAAQLAPTDPQIRHEMGIIRFHERKYSEAHALFLEAASMVEKPHHKLHLRKWEPVYNNLAHTARKLKRFGEAYFYHRKALLLRPSNAGTHACLGFLHAMTGKIDLSIEAFHKSLSFKRDDIVSNTMLRHVVDKLVEDSKDGGECTLKTGGKRNQA